MKKNSLEFNKMPKKNSTFFCLLCAERLINIFDKFSRKFDITGDHFYLLEELFNSVTNKDIVNYREILQQVENTTPDSEEYSDVLADQAQCYSLCVLYAVEFIRNNDFEAIEYCKEKVEEAIEILGYEGLETRKMLQDEKEWVKHLNNKLSTHTTLTFELISELREKNRLKIIPAV